MEDRRRLNWIVLIFLFTSCTSVFGQAKNKILYQPEYDAKTVRFGYFMGISSSEYRIKLDQSYFTADNDTVHSITSPLDLALKLGAMMNFNLNDRYDFRILPTVAIYSRNLEVNQNPDLIKSREQAWFELGFLMKYKAMRRGNYRMNMFAGLRPGFETNATNLLKKSSITKTAGLRTMDLNVEYGVGAEFFRQFFKLAPEVHFSHGIKNMLDKGATGANSNAFSYLQRLNTHTITFYLFFE